MVDDADSYCIYFIRSIDVSFPEFSSGSFYLRFVLKGRKGEKAQLRLRDVDRAIFWPRFSASNAVYCKRGHKIYLIGQKIFITQWGNSRREFTPYQRCI